MKTPDLRVIIRTISQSPKPYSWIIIDDDDGHVVQDCPDRFRTSLLAWNAGVSALARSVGSWRRSRRLSRLVGA
jgi:hypothetical protein